MVDRVSKAILLTSSKLTQDPFWQEVLEHASRGSLPQFFSLQQSKIVFNKKKKRLEFSLSTNCDLFLQKEDLIEFFRRNGGIYSSMDNQWAIPTCPALSWNDVMRRPRIMEYAVFIYTRTVCRHAGVSDSERQLLHARIIYAIRSGQIHTVKYVDGIIMEIPQLQYDQAGQQFVINGRTDVNMMNSTYIDPRLKIRKRG